MMAAMAGQLFVHDVELKLSQRKLADDAPVGGGAFLRLPFEEAIAHFEGKAVLTPEEFAAMQDAERFRSFTMSQVASQQIVENAFEQLNRAMEPGGPGLREFQRQVRADEAALGFTPSSRGYIENVYRTSTATSYNAGRLEAQTSAALPGMVWEYVTAGDGRVRDEHAALDGKQWPVGDPEALSVYPPNGYQCRCSIVVVEADDADSAALSREIDVTEAVTEGFRGPPTAHIESDANAG